MSYKLRDRKPSCSDSEHGSTCTDDEYDSMGSTGDSRKRRMRGGGVKRKAAQKEEEAAVVPLQTPKKKTRGRVKLDNEFIENTLRRRKIFSVRKNGLMKKVEELTKLTGTQVLLLVASETGRVYNFASDKLQPMFTSEAGNALIQSCLNLPQGCPPHNDDDDDDAPTGDSRKRRKRGGVKHEEGQKEEAAIVPLQSPMKTRSTNDESKPSFNKIMASLPTTTSAQSNMVPTTTTTTVQDCQDRSGHSYAPTSSPLPHNDAPTDEGATAAPGLEEKMDLTFQASWSFLESLGSTNDESKPSFNVLPGTTTSSSSSSDLSMVPTTTTTSTVQESSGLQLQQHSHDPASSLLPMEDHVMYPSAPDTTMYNIPQETFDLMEFVLGTWSADTLAV